MISQAWGIKYIIFNSVLAHCAGWLQRLNNYGVFRFKWLDLFNSVLSIVFFCSHDPVLPNLVFYLSSKEQNFVLNLTTKISTTFKLLDSFAKIYLTKILSLLARPCYPSNRNNSPFHAFHSLYAWMQKILLLFLCQPFFYSVQKIIAEMKCLGFLLLSSLDLQKRSVCMYVFFWTRSDSQSFLAWSVIIRL